MVEKKKEPKEVSVLGVKQLNDAAQLLIDQLPDHAGELLESLAKQYTMPLWQYTTGILLAVHLEGRLSEFRLDPAWKSGLKTKELICKHCKKPFTPKHIGQPYCSNECGLAATGPKEHIANEPIRIKPTRSPDPGQPANWSDAGETLAAA